MYELQNSGSGSREVDLTSRAVVEETEHVQNFIYVKGYQAGRREANNQTALE